MGIASTGGDYVAMLTQDTLPSDRYWLARLIGGFAVSPRELERGALEDGFTLRDVRRNQWRSLTTDEAIQAALDWLEDEDWLRSDPTGGHLSTRSIAIGQGPTAGHGGARRCAFRRSGRRGHGRETPGGGSQPKSKEQPHAIAFAPCIECRARTRSGQPCHAPAMPNGRCRMHGGKSPGGCCAR